MLACGDNSRKNAEDARQSQVGTTEDTAQQNVDGCVPNDSAFPGLQVTTTDISTVPQIQWTGEPSEMTYLDGMGIRRHVHSSSANGNAHVVFPLGLRPNETYTGQLVRRDGQNISDCSSVFEMTTQALPAGFPEIDVTVIQRSYGTVGSSLLELEALSADSTSSHLPEIE